MEKPEATDVAFVNVTRRGRATAAPVASPAPRALPDFAGAFPTEESCNTYLFATRFPNGFVCPKCGIAVEPIRLTKRPFVLRCRTCRNEASLIAGTVMHRTKVPICTWFWAAYLVTTRTPGMSALQLQKALGIGRYETAFQMLHKLRAAMVRPERTGIGGEWVVEVDEKWVGGATQGEGRGVHHKTLVVGAVEVRPRSAIPFSGADPNMIAGSAPTLKAHGAAQKGVRRKVAPKSPRGGHGRGVIAGRLRLQVVPGRTQKELEPFVLDSVAIGSEVKTDGWTGYDRLAALGYRHNPLAIQGDQAKTEKHLPMIHIVFGNLDAWLLGTHHGVSPQHLQAYLNEFTFRFNRRFWPMAAFDAVLGIGMQGQAPTYAGIYEGTWAHPGGWDTGGGVSGARGPGVATG